MVFDFIPPEVEPWLWGVGITGVLSWMTHQAYCLRQQRKRSWRMEKAFIISLKLQAKLTRQAHPDEPEIIKDVEEIEEIVNVVLKDSDDEEFQLFK